jgi:hypothetical protein
MTAAEQLARIARLKPQPLVKIYTLESNKPGAVAGFWPSWLCSRHLERRKKQGYEVKVAIDPPHELVCDDRGMGECGR